MKQVHWAGHAAVRARYVLFLVVAAVAAHFGYDSSRHSANDWVIFEVAARTLTYWHHLGIYDRPPLHLYSDNPAIQIGPPAILPILPFQHWFSPYTVSKIFVGVMAVMGVASMWFVEAAGRQLTTMPAARLRAVALGMGLPLVAAWSYESGQFHHLDDAMALLFVSIAVWLLASHRPAWLVGLALGVSVATKPWAIVVVPLVLGLPRVERAKAVLAAFVGAVAWWAPFVVAAPDTIHRLGSLLIVARPGSILWLVGEHGQVQGWLRPAQFIVGLAAAGYVAHRGRWTAAPMVGIAVRVALDPYAYGYYGLGPVLSALVWDVSRPGERRVPTWTIWTLVVEFGLPPIASTWLCEVARLLWVISALAVFLAARRPPAALESTADKPVIASRTQDLVTAC